MLDIYLCEDDKAQLNNWRRIVEKYLLITQEECLLCCAAATPHELLIVRKKSVGTGLYFLDIDLQASINGLELAQEIRKLDPRGYIVFITTHDEMSQLTFRYRVEAMDFILKDDPEAFASRFCECIKSAVINHSRKLINNFSAIRVKSSGDSFTIDQNDIVCIKTSDLSRKVVIHTTYGIRQVNGSIKEQLKYLNSSFFQCSRSAVVNLEHIKEYQISDKLLLLDNKDTIQVSFRMAGKLKKMLKEM